MFGFVKKCFYNNDIFCLQCTKLCFNENNQECKIRLGIINVSSNEPLFYPYIIEINKCSSSCNNINDPYAKSCVPDVVKNINVQSL